MLARLGIEPAFSVRLAEVLDRAVDEAGAGRSPGGLVALDAGCGHKSPLQRCRSRIGRLTGIDVHEPDALPAYLDAFAVVDLCRASAAFAPGTFDLVLTNFTLEHFQDPPIALANLHRWLRPGGGLVVTTVNRRHPFVAAYLGMPDGPRRRLQPVLKASAADAHPLVGACNDPATIRSALRDAGFDRISIETVPNLGRAWGRHLATFALGLAGDLVTSGAPSRRSTIIATARRPPA